MDCMMDWSWTEISQIIDIMDWLWTNLWTAMDCIMDYYGLCDGLLWTS